MSSSEEEEVYLSTSMSEKKAKTRATHHVKRQKQKQGHHIPPLKTVIDLGHSVVDMGQVMRAFDMKQGISFLSQNYQRDELNFKQVSQRESEARSANGR